MSDFIATRALMVHLIFSFFRYGSSSVCTMMYMKLEAETHLFE